VACGAYVELNPVRAGMVKDPKEYPWSSYTRYAYGKEDVLLDTQPSYLHLGRNTAECQQKYRQFVKDLLKEKKAMKGEMDRRLAYGNSDFIGMLTTKHTISGELRARGRPKKPVEDVK
jgi:putative transposase